MDKSKNNKKDFGISLLRIILSFMVVVDHLGDHKINNKYKNILYYHIPTFFLISFYYTAKKLNFSIFCLEYYFIHFEYYLSLLFQ